MRISMVMGQGYAGLKGRAGLLLLVMAVAFSWPAEAGPLASPGCLDGGNPAIVTGVDEAFDLRLTDGRVMRLPGVDVMRETASKPGAEAEARQAMQSWLVGRQVRAAPVQSEPDRWGRTQALVFAPDPAADPAAARFVSVAEALLDSGFARARPDPAIARCWRSYLALETRARQAGDGVWSDPFYAVIPAADTAALSARTGTMAVVEGRTGSLRVGHGRSYLPMDDKGRSGFAITIEQHAARRLAKAGTDPAAWAGKHVRVRGFLDDRFGLQIEVSSADQVEVVDP